MICIGITKFNYIGEPNVEIEDTYNIQMSDDLLIYGLGCNKEYIETDSNDVKIVVKHSKYFETNIYNENEMINIYCYEDESKVMELFRQIIDDINNKEIKNYYEPTIYIYTSKSNIEKIKQNERTKYEKNQEKEIDDLYESIDELENKIYELETELEEKESTIESLNDKIDEKNSQIEMLEE